MLVGWEEMMRICQMNKSEFCIEVEIEGDDFQGKY